MSRPEPLYRLLFVHSSDPDDALGGGETTLISLIRRLPRDRFLPMVAISGPGEFQRRLQDAGVLCHVVPMDPLYYKLAETGSRERLLRAANALPSVYRLLRLVRRHRIDLVATNVQAAHIYGALAASLGRRPLLMYLRDIPHGSFSSRFFPRWAARFADHLVAISHAVANFYRDAPGVGERCGRKLSVVHNGIDLQHFAPRPADTKLARSLGLVPGAPVITMLGRLQPLKGQHLLIEAAPRILARFPQARFLLVGDAFAYEDGYRDQLHQLARSLGSAVVFAGRRRDVPALLSLTDILVSASSHEAFGRTLVEAMAMGRPVVATRSGGPDDIVVDGETGYLTPVGDASALADALIRMWSDPAAARAMGRRGRERAHAQFAVDAMVARASAVFEQVLDRPGRRRFS